MLIHSAVITGSVQLNNTDVSSITNVAGFATTASVDSLVVKTGSYASTSSVNELQSKTGSYATTSSVNNLQSVTGSYATTSSFGAYTSSNDTTNTTQNTRLSTIESVTGSYATTSSVNNLQSVTGSYATTGSNQFNGNQSISGSITSNGTITAQTLVVQTVTSSIEFVTGSTRNGSLSSNTHEFTGSLFQTGSTAAFMGNVGIGTTNPTGISSDAKLAVTNGSFIIDTENNGYGGLKIDTDSTGDYNVNFRQGRGGALGGIRFFTNGRPGGGGAFTGTGNERLTILGTGNVGIGTSSPAYRTHIAATGSSIFLGISNQGSATGDRQLRIGFGGNGLDTFASIQGTRLSIADDVSLALQSGGGQVIIGGTSIRSELGSNTKLSIGGGSIGSVQVSGAGALDLGISIDQFNAGLTLLFLASRNTSNATSTASAVYIISFYYDGGNFPSITYLGGTNNFVTFGSSGGKLTATNPGSGNAAYSWFTTR